METRRGVLLRGVVLCWTAAATVFARAAADPVAEGFPAWEGLEAENRVCGRALCPSDLRHKITIVVEIEPTDEKSAIAQMALAAKFTRVDSTFGMQNSSVLWKRKEVGHRVSLVVVNYGDKDSPAVIKKTLAGKVADVGKDIVRLKAMRIPVYNRGVAFPGAPQASGGKRPFVYVMGPEGTKPLYSGALDAKGSAAVVKLVKKESASLPNWRRFYGPLEEVKHFRKFSQALDPAKPKPLAPVMQKIKKGISSKDPEEAREAQILFDAVEQTRSELVYRISMEAVSCPHLALYDLSLHSRYFPMDKKSVEVYADMVKRNSDAQKLCAILKDVLAWSDPEFACKNKSEAKKIVGKLKGMKKTVEKLKEAKSLPIQNGAYVLSGEIDQLIENIPMKVVSK